MKPLLRFYRASVTVCDKFESQPKQSYLSRGWRGTNERSGHAKQDAGPIGGQRKSSIRANIYKWQHLQMPTFTNGNIYKWAVRQANKWDKRTFKLKEDKQHRLQIYSGSKPAFAGTPKMWRTQNRVLDQSEASDFCDTWVHRGGGGRRRNCVF